MMVCSLRITKRMALSRYFIITFHTLRQLVYDLVFGFLYTSYRKGKKGNVCIRVSGFFGRNLSQFLKHEETRNISTSPRMRCKFIAGLHPALNLPVPIFMYTLVEACTATVKCLALEHNTVSPAKARTRSIRSPAH